MARQQSKTSGADHNVMRELNRSLVLDLLKHKSPISRAAIAKATALAKPTVSAIVDDLLTEGLVREIGVGATTTGGGRPPILLEFNARSQYVAGVHIGVRRTTIVIADARGQEVGRHQAPTPKAKPADQLKKVAASIKDTMKKVGAPRDRLAAIGVVVPGLTDIESGVCLLAPNLGWRDVPMRDLLEQSIDVPIFVHNAMHAVVVAESVEGAGQGETEIAMLYLGTGIGAGMMIEGRLFHGGGGLAGEIGHCAVSGATERCNCGKIGCLETVANGPAIARAAHAALAAGKKSLLSAAAKGANGIRPEDVADAAAKGDRVALDVLEAAGREIGIAASWLINLFNPAVLIIGGGLVEAGEPLLQPLRQAAKENALPQAAERVDIRVSPLGQDLEVRGAVLLALQYAETYYRVIFQG